MQYLIEWVYEDGLKHSDYCNTLEQAEKRGNLLASKENIFSVVISKLETVKVLKPID